MNILNKIEVYCFQKNNKKREFYSIDNLASDFSSLKKKIHL